LSKDEDPSKETPEERTAGFIVGINNFYSRPIAGLGLSSQDEGRLRQFLLERAEAMAIAHDVVAQANAGHPGDFGRAINAALADVDVEMGKAFDAQTYEKIKAMLDATPYLGLISHSYDTKFMDASQSLSARQYLSLAIIMSDSYRQKGSDLPLPPTSAIDPNTGFSPPDYLVLERAEAVLSAPQISVLKRAMIDLNKKRLGQNKPTLP
jgi:hypothetical protein